MVIPTETDSFVRTVALMNSILTHTEHAVKFTIVLSDFGEGGYQANHLKKWIDNSDLVRYPDISYS